MSDVVQPVKHENRTSGYNHDPDRLKWRRVAVGMSLTDAARKAGCDKGHLSKLEHGRYGASPGLLAKFASLYGCEITDLMPDEPNGAAA